MIKLKCDYSKKLGLPGYSSHQFSISLETEITDVSQVEAESARLYKLLQEGVDTSIKEIGYLPANGNGNGNGHSNGHSNANGNGNGHTQPSDNADWGCSPKQRDLILKIVAENHLEKAKVEGLAHERFGKTVKALNKLEASALIEELLEQTGQNKKNGRNRFQGRFPQKAGAR